MSEAKKVFEHQAQAGMLFPKLLKWLGWLGIALGALLTITIIGAIIGIPMIVTGIVSLFLSKYLSKQMMVTGKAMAEAAEIHEHNLRNARNERDRT
ncbi:MAG: DUF5362 family protein [Moraxellaceae bacterium]|nr:DUF5362 family protein [Moraxellaceae bacterium]